MRKGLIGFIVLVLVVLPLNIQARETDAIFTQAMRPAFSGDLARFPDIPHYTVNLTFDPTFDQTTLSGQITIEYTNRTPDTLDDIVLRMYPNLPSFGANAVIENVTVNGTTVDPSLDETRSVVGLILPEPLLVGAAATIQFDYTVVVRQGVEELYRLFSYIGKELALASVLPLLSVYDPNTGWWRETDHKQGDAVYSEIANFDVMLNAPAYLKVIASGSLVGETTSANGEMITLHYAAPLMRDFSIMASADYQTISSTFEDVTVNVHYLPGVEDAAPLVMQYALDAMETYTTYYGDYVYSELDIVETHTTAGGIEYPGLIVVADDLWTPDDFFLRVVTVHEVGHQWWYSMVGNDQITFPWLDEALTDFSVAQYFRFIQGDPGYQASIESFVEQYTNYENEFSELEVGMPSYIYPEGSYSPIVYRKGAYFLYTLGELMSLDTMLIGLQQYLQTYRYGVATPFDLQTILEQVSGMQLDDLFNEWIGYSN